MSSCGSCLRENIKSQFKCVSCNRWVCRDCFNPMSRVCAVCSSLTSGIASTSSDFDCGAFGGP